MTRIILAAALAATTTSAAAHGKDNQLERAITEIDELLKKVVSPPNRPAPEVR